MKVKRWMKSLETQRLLWMMTVVLCMMAAPAWADIQQAMQTLRGKVVDVASGEPMPGVTLRISDMEGVATVSDADGQFQFVGIPVGRHTLEATFLGYDPVIIKELLLSTSSGWWSRVSVWLISSLLIAPWQWLMHSTAERKPRMPILC